MNPFDEPVNLGKSVLFLIKWGAVGTAVLLIAKGCGWV